VTIKRDAINYEKLSLNALNGVENLILLDEVNILSVLKDLSVRIDTNLQNNFIIQDIFVIIENNSNSNLNSSNPPSSSFKKQLYDILEWYDHMLVMSTCQQNKITLIKTEQYRKNFDKISDSSAATTQFEIFCEIVKYKNLKIFEKYQEFLELISELLDTLDIDFFFSCSFSEKLRNFFNFSMIPIVPSDSEIIKMKSRSILKNSKIKNKGTFENLRAKIFSLFDFENFPMNLKTFFLEISSDLLDKHFDFIELIFILLEKMKIEDQMKHVFNLLMLNFFFINFNYYNNIAKIFKNIKNCNKEIFTFYANTILIFLFIYLSDVISLKFKSSLNTKIIDKNKLTFLNFLLSYESKSTQKSMNEIIFNHINEKMKFTEYSLNQMNELFSSFYEFYDSDSNSIELEIISEVENNFDLDYFLEFYKAKNEDNSMIYCSNKIFDLLSISLKNSVESLENKNFIFKQIWSFDFENFTDFIKSEEDASKFIYKNKILEYVKFFQSSKKSEFLVEYSIRNFFLKFLPILSDIDTKFNAYKKYKNVLTEFLVHLQKYEEFSEEFDVTDTHVRLNHYSFSILLNILKNFTEEKVIFIQKIYRGQSIHKFFKIFKLFIIKIQTKWREFKIKKFDFEKGDDCFNYVWTKFKDPQMIKIIMRFNKNSKKLEAENFILREEIFNFKKKNESIEKKNFELMKKIDVLNETTQNLKQKIRENESLSKIENVVENNSLKFNRASSNNKKNTIKSAKSQIESKNLKIQRKDSSLKNEVIIIYE